MAQDSIAVVGAGRMGRGIVQTFAFAGMPAILIDLKQRRSEDFERLATEARREIEGDLRFMAEIGVGSHSAVSSIIDRISIVPAGAAGENFGSHAVIFEGVPETIAAKQEAFAWVSAHAAPDAIIASTTSTISVDKLAEMVKGPHRFMNAHWLNPPHLMPLVEVARGTMTDQPAVDHLVAMLEAVGKVPVVMANSPGYVVPRIQALAMSETARLYQEGVASAEDIDKAIRIGFGIRFAVLGMLEFIDFGGNDILYHANNHLSRTVDSNRYAMPDIVRDNMHSGRNGMRDGAGYYAWESIDIADYRRSRLADFVSLLRFMNLLPKAAD